MPTEPKTVNQAGEQSLPAILQAAEEKREREHLLGQKAQLTAGQSYLVKQAAQQGIDVNTGQALAPGQTPPPLDGSHPITHAEQLGIAQPYQTEREENAQAKRLRSITQVSEQDEVEIRSKLESTFTPLSPKAEEIGKRFENQYGDKLSLNNPIPVSSADLDALMDDEFARVKNLGMENLSRDEVLQLMQTDLADSQFFEENQIDRNLLVAGHPSFDGRGVMTNDFNYYKLGMIAAAANLPKAGLNTLIVGYNAYNIPTTMLKNAQHNAQAKTSGKTHRKVLDPQIISHNVRQMAGGAYWANFGYDEYLKRTGKQP